MPPISDPNDPHFDRPYPGETHKPWTELTLKQRDGSDRVTIILSDETGEAFYGNPISPSHSSTHFSKDEWQLADENPDIGELLELLMPAYVYLNHYGNIGGAMIDGFDIKAWCARVEALPGFSAP